jgi:exoribonuclease-2
LKNFRQIHGSLSLETIEAKVVFDGDQISALEIEEKNRAREIIEDFMIAANGVVARYLSARKFLSIGRVVRTPKRWDRIVEIAGEHKFSLPDIPDSKALEEFLVKEKAADPLHFPDLSYLLIFWALANMLPFLKNAPGRWSRSGLRSLYCSQSPLSHL